MVRSNLLLCVLVGIFLVGCGDKRRPWRGVPSEKPLATTTAGTAPTGSSSSPGTSSTQGPSSPAGTSPAGTSPAGTSPADTSSTQESPSQGGVPPTETYDPYYDSDDYDDIYDGPYEPSQPTPSPALANVPEPTESDPPPPPQPEPERVPVTSFAEVQPLFATHCAMCHPATSPPDWQDYAAAKAYVDNGKLYEKIWILYQSNDPLAMPLGNTTGMTEDERQQIIRWIEDGGAE